MNRFLALIAALLIGAAPPMAAQAQGRVRMAECPQGPVGKACREAARERAFDAPGARPPGPRVGGNSLGDGWRPEEDDAREGVRGGRLVPLEAVIRNIARSTPGRLLDAGLENWGGRQVYRVRWQAADGRRIDFIVDARSGSIISAD